MDIIDEFLSDYATPERRDILMGTHELLMDLGYNDHLHEIEEYVANQGNLENTILIMQIESALINACRNHTLSYHLVCNQDVSIVDYNTLLSFLEYIENTIESDVILYYLNGELDPTEQLLSWVEVFQPEKLNTISELLLTVTKTLIENIVETHELRSDIQPVEYNAKFHKRIECLKQLKYNNFNDLIAVRLIKSNAISDTVPLSKLNSRFNKEIYAMDVLNPEITPYNVISLAIFTDGDIPSLSQEAKKLVNLLYDDLKKVSNLISAIDVILNESGELCKIMNTI